VSRQRPDALTVVDVDPGSPRYGQVVGWADLPTVGDELHHFGWNVCSSALAHEGHNMNNLERRYLLLPGLRSSNVHIYDTRPDPTSPTLVKTIDAKELAAKAGYSRPHTLHCGPEWIFVSCLGGADSADGPGGIALLDHSTFDVLGPWETDRGPQYLAYDAWWHLAQNTLVTSEWGTPSMIEDGVNPELLLGNKYGHALHFWDLAAGKHLQRVDLGAEHQMVLELRPAHDPQAAWGFVGVVVSTQDLRLGGIVSRAAHPAASDQRLAGGPQMVEVSRDGRRVYLTNSLYGAWDDQFYPDGVGAWLAKIDADPIGGLAVDREFFLHGDDFRGLRVHQVRLQGGDASSDSYCYR
jgi:selenium binding protein SBP56